MPLDVEHHRHQRVVARRGDEVDDAALAALWDDIRTLMRAGVRSGRIVTTRPGDRGRSGRARREDAHYVYRRAGLPCRVCGTPIQQIRQGQRSTYFCQVCQKR